MAVRIDLSGRAALVSGGTRGLGYAIAASLAEAGAKVIVAGRTQETCDAAAADIAARYGVSALGIAAHVGRWSECDRLLDAAISAFGGIDILINNAGIAPGLGPSCAVEEALFDKIVAVNLKGPFRLSARAGAHMMARGGGAIVNIGSSSATHPLTNGIPYSASKAALANMTKAFAGELGPTVRVNCVEPWGMETDMSSSVTPAHIAELARNNAIKRFARPEEVAWLVLHLVSDAASFTTGAVMRVDGGLPG